MAFKFQKREVMTNSDTGKDIIKKEIPLIAKLPGVYKMLNEKNEVLYVGKLSLIHISEPTRHASIAYAVFCLKKRFF